jgi:tetratricopeptide (TPR) repeat protein
VQPSVLHQCFLITLTVLTLCTAASANGPEPAKPHDRPAANATDDSSKRKSAPTDLEIDLQRRIDAEQARDHADRLRAAYESTNKPGPVPKESREQFDEVIAAYAAAIDRPIATQEIAQIILNCRLRLAGAYQYTQQFDKALAQAKKAAKEFAGAPQELEAVYNLGLIHLQAFHDPKSALEHFQRAHELATRTVQEPNERSKWLTATSEAIHRCEKELPKK